MKIKNMKIKPFWAIIIFAVVCLGLGISLYLTGFNQPTRSVTAGWFDWFGTILGGLDCAERIARCTSDMARCKRRVEEESKRCDDQYDRYARRCNKYEEKADSYFPKCVSSDNRCKLRAGRYRDKAELYEGVKRERYLYLYQDYLNRCEEQYNRCQVKAQNRKNRYLERASDCRWKAGEIKDRCENRYLERQARKVEQCIRKARRCLERLMDRCGPLVPGI